MPYAEIFSQFPPELQQPIARLVDTIREDFGVRRSDFEELKTVVGELAQAQQRTEMRVEELAQAQKELAVAQRELAEAQRRTDDELTLFRRTFTSQIGGLGARWGLQSESAFREDMEAILQEVGFTTERFLAYDEQGEVFGEPDQIELDVVIKNGKVIVIEIKSSVNKADVHYFKRKVAFYARKTGRQVSRRMIVTPYADPRTLEAGIRLGVELYTDVNSLPPP